MSQKSRVLMSEMSTDFVSFLCLLPFSFFLSSEGRATQHELSRVLESVPESILNELDTRRMNQCEIRVLSLVAVDHEAEHSSCGHNFVCQSIYVQNVE